MGNIKSPSTTKLVDTDHQASILLVPMLNINEGSGHLIRMIALFKSFGTTACFYDPNKILPKLLTVYQIELLPHQLCHNFSQQTWSLIVLDQKATSLEEVTNFMQYGRVVGIDEGGQARQIVPYIIDILPLLKERGLPNETNPGYLALPKPLPKPEQLSSYLPRRALVTFGGSDQAKLTEVIGQFLDELQISTLKWKVVKGPFFNRTFAWPGITILKDVNVKEIVNEYDIVFTHFGITAYEALNAGVTPILLNPTEYHEKLAQEAGFYSLGVKQLSKKNRDTLRDFLLGKNKKLLELDIDLGQEANLAQRLDELRGPSYGCPICSTPQEHFFGTVIFRNYEKSYAQCPKCHLVYVYDFKTSIRQYDEDYFFTDYKAQYGKTYLEDFDHIKTLGLKRLATMKKFFRPKKSLTLLDIGCAYGSFLVAAQEKKIDAYGLDTSANAIDYVKENITNNAFRAHFPEENPFADYQFNIVTLWYAIEHFNQLDNVFKALNNMLEPNGIVAFSTPKGDGLTAKFASEKFYTESPTDHYVIFSKKSVKKILKNYGFMVLKIKTTGVHVERRFKNIKPKSLTYKFLTWVFQRRGLGDTFEIYARKIL